MTTWPMPCQDPQTESCSPRLWEPLRLAPGDNIGVARVLLGMVEVV